MSGNLSLRLICAGVLLTLMMTAVPAQAQCSGVTSYTVALPHIAYGGGWQTTLFIRNTSANSASVTACYYDDNGNPLSVPFNGVGATSSTVTVPANGQAEIAPDSSGTDTVAGWAGFAGGLPAGVSAQAVFVSQFPSSPAACIISIPDQGSSTSTSQAVAPIVSSTSGSLSMPFDNTNGQVSGYAFANTSNQSVTLTLTFYSESASQLATYTPSPLAAFGHTQFLLNASGLPSALANAKGVMVLSSSSVFPLGFRFALSGTSIESFSTWLP